MAHPHRRWMEEQITALVEAGVDLADAQRSVNWVLAHLPANADPRVWRPSPQLLAGIVQAEAIRDARADWYASDAIPPRFKRLLDAANEAQHG